MKRSSAAALLVAALLIACSREQSSTAREDRAAEARPEAAPAAQLHEPRMHVDSAAGTELLASPHAQHMGERQRAEGHARHAPVTPAGQAHAAHAPEARADTARMAHGQVMPVDTAHAAHAPDARVDTMPAAHADVARQDTTHAAHADVTREDTAHAAHADVTREDTAHAAHAAPRAQTTAQHRHGEMTMVSLGSGWMGIGMAQVFPTVTVAAPSEERTPLARTGAYLTQPALMFNLESPGSGLTLRTTLNLEGITQPGGELTYGAWGEGFLDKRHPHTFLHEAMLSLNLRQGENRGASVSLGKGFAPFGTDDPMMRPVVKYPTNHHLSQILERWTISGAWATPSWSVEAGVFGGTEPTGPWDFRNIESFADSWSVRVTRRIGMAVVRDWPWELSASFGRVREEHDGEAEITRLYNLSVRREYDHGTSHIYTMLEGSWSDPAEGTGDFSVLAEANLQRGAHKPYARIEYASRPEWAREGTPDTPGFFRYDHDADPIGATRWLSLTAGYGVTATALPFSARPYLEAQFHRVGEGRGSIDPVALFGRNTFWSLSAGFRVFLGGEPMRMGAYGILDPMTMMHRMQMRMVSDAHDQH